MGELTYPREWFCAPRWSDKPRAEMFDRETEHRLFRGKRFEAKVTQYHHWYPTKAEAQAAIDARLAHKAERKRIDRIRDAAPELLEALQELVACPPTCQADFAQARAAIAKATGQ